MSLKKSQKLSIPQRLWNRLTNSSKKSTPTNISLKKKYKLNLPQLLWGGLSENWLSKELGDVHWEQITKALGRASGEITDGEGNRLYASFVRVRWSGDNISNF
jgi:hypothetical protein